MFNMTPTEYVQWLIGVNGLSEDEAKTRVEKLYLRQTGKAIKLFLRPYKNEMVWDYTYAE